MILEYLQTYEWQKWNFYMISVKFTQMGAAACIVSLETNFCTRSANPGLNPKLFLLPG